MKFLIPILFLLISQLLPAQNSMRLNHYTTSNGLSNNAVVRVYQDKKGFIWIGTNGGGLNKFDGYRFTIYDFQEDSSQSLSNNRISAITEDNEGNLWVGTNNGLNRLDPNTGHFQQYFHDSLKSNSLKHNRVTALLVDEENNLWIGTYLGLQKFNYKSKTFTDYSSEMTSQDNRVDREVTCIVDDGKGNLWMGVWWGGLKKLNKKTGQFTDYYSNPEIADGLRSNDVLSLCIDNTGNLWIGNYSGGLRKLSLTTGKFLPVKNPENNATIWSICIDQKGLIWYTRTGLGVINNRTGQIRLIDYSKNEAEGISSGYHFIIYCDRSGILWLGSSEGLSVYNSFNERFAPYTRLIDQEQRFYITTFYRDSNQPYLWLGTFGNGVIRFNEKTGQYIRYLYGNGKDPTLPENYISYILGDNKNQIWVATDNGIVVLDKQSGAVKRYIYHNPVKPTLNNNIHGNNSFMFAEGDSIRVFDILHNRTYAFPIIGPRSLPSRVVLSVLPENDSILWIGTAGGLVRYYIHSDKLEPYTNKRKRSNSIMGENIRSMFRDRHGNMWVGTQNGLNHYDVAHNCFVRYHVNSASQSINQIAEDLQDNLWLVTDKGITKFNPGNGQIRNYDETDGLKTDGALFIDQDGRFYCNRSREGYYVFHPDSIKDNLQKPLVYITRLFLFNKEVQVSSDKMVTPLKTNILNAREITLKHNQTVISLEFTAINFTLPEKNKFAYKLEGFDHNWYTTDATHRIATYTNLNPGVYIFSVKASNSDGIWSGSSADLKIRILPPPWKTWWAYLIYVVTTASVLLYFRHSLLQKEKLKNKIKIEAMEYEKKLKMDEMKMRFFGNISHEFRTPLTLIMAPIHGILQTAIRKADKQTSEHAGLALRNANRLADLINQLLDMQKLEAKSLRPEICQGNPQQFVKSIFDKFAQLSIQKNIRYQFSCREHNIEGWFDPDKTEKIVTNLLSNAFKFTGNRVNLELTAQGSHITICVEDNGRGIPQQDHHRIFERFYHSDDAAEKIQEGTGIGLSLVKEMVDLLGGKIEVTSEPEKSTCFRVDLPLEREAFPNYLIRSGPSVISENFIPANAAGETESRIEPTVTEKNPLILIVEDSSDLRKYLQLVLSSKYRTIEAVDGKDGLMKARQHIPDMIVSDVIMPAMDGVEMAHILKNDDQTNHIPIILLTSLVSTDSKLKGLETGVDDYITKPFNEDVLLIRISNLIKQRKLLRHFYASKYRLPGVADIQPKEPEVENVDEIFLGKTIALVEKFMDDPEFTNEKFATGMGMSVAVLYRKMNALMNCTPADFIRDLRLKRAVQLLNTGKLSVSEVAGKVGFDDPHYFGKWFKKNYGKTPSEVMPD
jgi:signal transduction histidine kinase/ligand-binding sensor domain-containing protein/CheY-like chemotaxis protein